MEKGNDLDLLPQQWKSGQMDLEGAAMKVMEVIYTQPGRFNLLDMDEDERSDFLLDTLPKFKRILERYDSGVGPLGAYIFFSIPGIRKSWERKRLDDAAGCKAAAPSVRRIYEDAVEKKAARVAEPCVRPYGEKRAAPAKVGSPLVFTRIFDKNRRLLGARQKRSMQRAALVLALKSAWYIDDSNVKRVSDYLDCSEEGLAGVLSEIKDSLAQKSKKRERLVELRDRAWFFVCKYRERLLELEPGSEEWAKTKKKLDYQLASWKNKNNCLQGGLLTVTPKNNDLAKLLRVKPYMISAFLKFAKKAADSGQTVFGKGSREEE